MTTKNRILVHKGLMAIQNARVCDGDGYGLEPERWRDGFVLTSAGQAVIDDLADAGALGIEDAPEPSTACAWGHE